MSESIRFKNVDTRKITIRKIKTDSTEGTLFFTGDTITNLVITNTTTGTMHGNVNAQSITTSTLYVSGTANISSGIFNESSITNATVQNLRSVGGSTITSLVSTFANTPGSSSIGTLIVSGNATLTSLLVADATIGNLSSTVFTGLNGTISNLSTTNTSSGSLIVSNSSTLGNILSNTFNASTGTIENLIVTNASIVNFQSTASTLGTLYLTNSLNTTSATTANLIATNASITNLNTLASTIGSLTLLNDLQVTSATAANINIQSGSITNLNVTNSTMTNVIITSSTNQNILAYNLNLGYNGGGVQVQLARSNGQYFNTIRTLANNDMMINNGSGIGHIFVSVPSGNIVGIGSVGDSTSATLEVTSSSGGGSALIKAGGIVTISNSTNSTNSSNGGSFTTYGGASVTRDLIVGGSITKGSGTFDIPHPVPEKNVQGYRLRHSFVESPNRGDNIYRFVIATINSRYTIRLPDYFCHLNENVDIYTNPQGHFGGAYAIYDKEENAVHVHSNTDGVYNVLIIGTRMDPDAKLGWDERGLEYQVI